MNSFLFSGYARLPQDVSHQALYKRVGVVVEVDRTGRIIHCTSTLIMDLARDFLNRLLSGRSLLSERAEIEQLVRYYYRGHSQSALVFALRKVFEAVDQSPLVLGDAVEAPPGAEAATTAGANGVAAAPGAEAATAAPGRPAATAAPRGAAAATPRAGASSAGRHVQAGPGKSRQN